MRSLSILTFCFLLVSCDHSTNKTKLAPAPASTSKVEIPLSTYRFEQTLFQAKPDQILQDIKKADSFYPGFSEIFLKEIVAADPTFKQDSLLAYIKGWTSFFKPVYDTAQKLFADFSSYEQEVRNGLQQFHRHFPEYVLPKKLITYIGALDGYGDIILNNALLIGLQHHLGRDVSFYKTEMVQQTYPTYLTYRFGPEYIAVNAVNLLIDDVYPVSKKESSLIVQMAEAGKRLYVLSQCLPDAKEYLLIGYSEKQLEDCYQHEASIWNFFVQNNLLQSADKSSIDNYMSEGPKTEELGESSPGKIAVFCGWQLIKKYMTLHPEMPLTMLMKADPEKIIQEAKYKP